MAELSDNPDTGLFLVSAACNVGLCRVLQSLFLGSFWWPGWTFGANRRTTTLFASSVQCWKMGTSGIGATSRVIPWTSVSPKRN